MRTEKMENGKCKWNEKLGCWICKSELLGIITIPGVKPDAEQTNFKGVLG